MNLLVTAEIPVAAFSDSQIVLHENFTSKENKICIEVLC